MLAEVLFLMKSIYPFHPAAILAFACGLAGAAEPLRFVPFHQVRMDDQIWEPKIRQLVDKTLPHAFTQTEVAQRRLQMCAEWLESGGKTPKPEAHRFNDSDLYKVMEGASLMIQAEPSPAIEKQMDRIIEVIARAQKPDGYLYISHIVGNPIVQEMGARPYSYELHSHELYNMGHLYEAAVTYARATGKTKLLAVAEKSAAHINRVFFEGDPAYNDGKPVNQAPGHQEIELGLVKLFNHTGNKLYLGMAKRFLDIRGVTFIPDGVVHNSPTYAQQHAPVAQQFEALGHAVRATYMYAAMAEMDSLLGTDTYSQALDAIWHDIVDRKMHITGGLGAVPGIEGFGPAYELPNKETYLETCAGVGNVFFNMRMFLKYRDAKYVDVAEIALLNNCLSGIGLDGTSFFYPNPLEADNGHQPRSGWFGCACCPSNVARLIPQVPGYMYAGSGNEIYCALYGTSSTSVELNGGNRVALRQQTSYPWSGNIRFQIDPDKPAAFKLHLRIPTWCGRQFVPGELYSYNEPTTGWTLEVNDHAVQPELSKGFAVLNRTWRRGDRVTLKFPTPVKANTCIDKVAANRSRVTFSRGPIMLCSEGVDNDGAVQRFFVNPTEAVARAKTDVLKAGPLAGLPQVTIPGRERKVNGESPPTSIKLIPYFAWSNRDRSSMITWLPTVPDLALPDLTAKENLKFAAVSASHTFESDSSDALRMRLNPGSSADKSIPRWTSWPQKGKSQWVEIDLGKAREITAVGAYFYDDQDGVRAPGSWRMEALSGTSWKPVEIYNTDQFSNLRDSYNTVRPSRQLVTGKLRIMMTPQNDQACVGLLSVDVEIKMN